MPARETDYDVAVIGAGDVGAAVARELARFELRIALIDRGDVGAGTSKANTALLHTGFDSKPGTHEARLVARGHALLQAYAAEVGIPIERTGALLVAWDETQLARFDAIEDNARACGHHGLRRVDAEELHRREPRLGPGARGALEVADEYIICPFTPPLAYATQAVLAGAHLRRGEAVTGLQPLPGGGWRVSTARANAARANAARANAGAGAAPDAGELTATWVINAAGLRSDEVHRMAGRDGFTVTPRRGELIVFDKLSRPLVNHIILPVPTAKTKGVLIAPTVFGNVMLGPTADDIDDKTSTSSTADGLARLRAAGRRLMPALLEHDVTAVYAGLRAATEHADYSLEVDGDARYACAGGVRSTGLTASMAIAEWMRDQLGDAGLELTERPVGLPAITMPNLGEAFPRPYGDAERIAADPAYGEIVCFCERVTRGEIRDAARSPIAPSDLDGLRRRTRALMGRCQGFFCGAHVAELMAAPERTP
ncbi:MAG TPA: NAD(P)/FAD-dependent oxidoreductase [Solirubrobacteraceae bacterium]|nr:NAD(P)/FAD-dependent oxidoreductase [Solirubrobacteraceae bacterium]